MDADTRMACSLVLSLLLSAGNLQLAAAGRADILDVGLRYVAAFVASFVVVGLIGRVFGDYLAAVDARRAGADDTADGTLDGVRLADE